MGLLAAGTACWSFDGSYILTRCDSMPSVAWVWDTSRLELTAVLQQSQPIKQAEWDPASNRCAGGFGAGQGLRGVGKGCETECPERARVARVLFKALLDVGRKQPTGVLELTPSRAKRRPQLARSSCRLALATGSSKIYLWTPEGASCVHIPLPGFRAGGLRWHPAGTSLVLSDKDAICCAYLC